MRTAQGEPIRILRYDIASGRERLLDVDYFGGLRTFAPPGPGFNGVGFGVAWAGSPDGRFVAFTDREKLQIAPSSNPLSLRRVAGTPTSNDRIWDLLWTRDGSRLFYVQYRRRKSEPFERRIYSVTPDGTSRALIGVFRQREAFGLVGVDLERRETYWLRTGEGGYASFTAIGIDSAAVRPAIPRGALRLATSIQLTPDFRAAVVDDRGLRIVRWDLPPLEGAVAPLYRLIETSLSERELRETTIGGIVLAPTDGLAFRLNRGGRFTTFFTRSLMHFGAMRLLGPQSNEGAPGPASFSPDGRYLLFERPSTRTTTTIMDLTTRRIAHLPRKPIPGVPEYRRFPALTFLAWLVTEPKASARS
jgi:hypothetical protein